ncbi:MAG: ABC transporter substrate-binding protein, partial [Symploca sp. SIO2E9]|nr:ABC transporter substrate-binding protein [Symploca sp. SIO2E9]
MIWSRPWLTIKRTLPLAVALALASLLALSGCSPSQFKSEAAQVSQLVFATPSDPATFNAPLNNSLYSVFRFINEGLLNLNGITAELEP